MTIINTIMNDYEITKYEEFLASVSRSTNHLRILSQANPTSNALKQALHDAEEKEQQLKNDWAAKLAQ